MTTPTRQPAPPVIRDWRRPGQSMESLPLKLPAALLERLTHRAALLTCSRAALARDLIAGGLSDLETAADEAEGARGVITGVR